MLSSDSDLIPILKSLQYLTSVLSGLTGESQWDNLGSDFEQIRQIFTPIQYHLVSRHLKGFEASQNVNLEELCYLVLRIYLKTVYDSHFYQQVGVSGARTDPAPIQRLKVCLDGSSQSSPFSLWILFLACSIVAGTKDRAWFMARVARSIMDLQINSWAGAKSLFQGFFWVDKIHEAAIKRLWDEAMVTIDVLFSKAGLS